jgi:hypothetical protein
MIILNDVTLIAIDGAGNRKAIAAVLKHCCKDIIFKDVKLLSANPALYPTDNNFKIIEIPKITYEEWNRFIIKELYQYIDTSHYLYVDTDGFIINPNLWDNAFLEYDYIGAPWVYPNHIMFTNCIDQKIKDREQDKINLVGNGGFTLRSKKLLELAKDYSDTRYNPEDVYLCTNNYDHFISNGIKYAPVVLANKFSQDPLVDRTLTFGFHGNKEIVREFSI